MTKRKTFTSEFKAKVVLELLGATVHKQNCVADIITVKDCRKVALRRWNALFVL